MIENFKKFGYHDRCIDDYSPFIEHVLDSIGYEYIDDYKGFDKYYLAFNPLIEDRNTMSAKIHRGDGIMLMYNGAIDVERNGRKISSNSIPPSEYSRLLGMFDSYIDFVVGWYNIDVSILREYKRNLIDYTIGAINLPWNKRKGMDNFRKFLFAHFITDKDILLYCQARSLVEIKAKFKAPKEKVRKTNITLGAILPYSERAVKKYCEGRRIPLKENVYPTMVSLDATYKIPAVCFNYPSGFKKLRFISGDADRRYLSHKEDGDYVNLFEAQVNGTSKCYVVEGEIESLSMTYVLSDDVYALHNTNSLPKDLSQLEKYDEIVFKIDYDKFNEVKSMIELKVKDLYPNKIIKVEPKIVSDDKYVDYNSLLLKDLLTKEIIESSDFSLDK